MKKAKAKRKSANSNSNSTTFNLGADVPRHPKASRTKRWEAMIAYRKTHPRATLEQNNRGHAVHPRQFPARPRARRGKEDVAYALPLPRALRSRVSGLRGVRRFAL
jgi:hypothetical protein